jgi:hypothetical protein
MNFAICIINIGKPELLDVIGVDAKRFFGLVWQDGGNVCLAGKGLLLS